MPSRLRIYTQLSRICRYLFFLIVSLRIIVEIRKVGCVFAYEARLVRINVNVSISESIGVMLRTPNIEFILVYRICIFFIKPFFKVLYVNTCLDLLRRLLKGSNV